MKIRLAQQDDLNAIMRTEHLCFGDERFETGVVRAILARRDSFGLVAMDRDEVVGAAMCVCSPQSSLGRIISVAVLEEYRRRGIASALIRECEEEFVSRGFTRFALEVASDNAAAIRAYTSSGYRIQGAIKDYYSHGRSAFYMEKDMTMDGRKTKVKVS